MPWAPKTNKIDKLKVPENRLPSSQRGYDNAWRMVRRLHLLNNPLCFDCLRDHKTFTVGSEVHHIKKLSEFPHLRDEPSNLMTLCKSCHSKRTRAGE
jgi:5-methylcytosine-specific restriction endonuclease McrA